MNSNVILGVAVAAVLVVGGGALWWFNTGDTAPSTNTTVPQIETTTTVAAEDPSSFGGEIPTLYEITDQSTATFSLGEQLRGNPVTVVGTSGIVLGQIQIDPADLANSQVGTILVNARDFETDSSNRNRAIRGPILDTDTFENIEFAPTSIEGLSGPLDPGAEFSFTVGGELKIRDIVNPVTFEVTASMDDRGFLVGTATTSVLRGDYELTIPNAPGVAEVDEEVRLELDFEAAPTS